MAAGKGHSVLQCYMTIILKKKIAYTQQVLDMEDLFRIVQ